MAVTYSWRIDSNKYAYIVPPFTLASGGTTAKPSSLTTATSAEWFQYGFLSNTPLTDYFARTVAATAEEKFGKSSSFENPSVEYQKAFAVMEEKIKLAKAGNYIQKGTYSGAVNETFNWSGLTSIEMLSADVYYDVDATECADLRGVGLKGVRYLGSSTGQTYVGSQVSSGFTGVDLSNISYVPSGQTISLTYQDTNGNEQTLTNIVVKPGIPGFTDVYGMYMSDSEDLDQNGSVIKSSAPEFMFVIRNGKEGTRGANGTNGSGGTSTGDVTEEQFTALQTIVNSHTSAITEMQSTESAFVEAWNEIQANGWGSITSAMTAIQTRLSEIESRLTEIETQLDSIGDITSGGDGDVSTEGSSIIIAKLPGTDPNPYDTVSGYSGSCQSGDTLYLLGYLMESGATAATTAFTNELYAIPYLRASGKQLDILTENVNISGNTLINGKTQVKNTFRVDNNVNFGGQLRVSSNLVVGGSSGTFTDSNNNSFTGYTSGVTITGTKLIAKEGFYEETPNGANNTARKVDSFNLTKQDFGVSAT